MKKKSRDDYRVTHMDNEDGTCTVMVVAPLAMRQALVTMLEALSEMAPTVPEIEKTMKVRTHAMPVGAKVRHWRQERGLSQTVVAKALSISQTRLSDMEQGVKSISPAQLALLAQVLEVPLYVLTDEEKSQ